MLFLTNPRVDPRHQAVLLFGAGLIGGRIAESLLRRGWAGSESPTPWDDDAELGRHLDEVERLVSDEGGVNFERLDIVWSAGRAGFAADEAQARGEEQNFRRVLDLLSRLAASSVADLVVHLVSSAGGLFEGQRHVDPSSVPSPCRPYGVLKLRQEELLRELGTRRPDGARPLVRRIYRLASVYGPAPRGVRRGLIGTLLLNAAEGRATPIVGQLTTLRDYVFTEDVARHLADACTTEVTDTCEVLASGKPTTIHEIVQHVGRVVHRVPRLVFAATRDNATDITFAPQVLPQRWSTTDLETAIFQLHQHVFEPKRAA